MAMTEAELEAEFQAFLRDLDTPPPLEQDDESEIVYMSDVDDKETDRELECDEMDYERQPDDV